MQYSSLRRWADYTFDSSSSDQAITAAGRIVELSVTRLWWDALVEMIYERTANSWFAPFATFNHKQVVRNAANHKSHAPTSTLGAVALSYLAVTREVSQHSTLFPCVIFMLRQFQSLSF